MAMDFLYRSVAEKVISRFMNRYLGKYFDEQALNVGCRRVDGTFACVC